MPRVTYMFLLAVVSVGCSEPKPLPKTAPQTNLSPAGRVRAGDAGGAGGAARRAELRSRLLLRRLAEQSGEITFSAGDIEGLKRRINNPSDKTDKVIILIDDSQGMQLRKSTTRPGEPGLYGGRVFERGAALPAGEQGDSIRRIFDSYEKIDKVIILNDGSVSEDLPESATRPGTQ